MKFTFLGLILVLVSCCRTFSEDYHEFYVHLETPVKSAKKFNESPYFLVILVNARHLDYTDNHSFFRTLTKHPSDGSKNCDVGHAWICLRGILDGQYVEIEGGHSGERGLTQAKYFDGVMNYIEFGYANPTSEQMEHPRFEENPIRYLWETQTDGFFQEGCGGHVPTFAAKIDLTEEQFQTILNYIQLYPYQNYSLIGNQCSSFVSQVAALADWTVPCDIAISIDPHLRMGGETIGLWKDPYYSTLTISSPDRVEKSLIQSVSEGFAQNAARWYLQTHPATPYSMHQLVEDIRLTPLRIKRLLLFR